MAQHPLSGKHVLVTGASAGIGRALALEVARRGARRVTLAARSQDKLESAAAEIRLLGAQPLALRTDVTQEQDVLDLIQRAIDEQGDVDVLVCNAGGGAAVRPGEVISRTEAIRRIMTLNFMSAVSTTLTALPSLRRSSGIVVAVSSVQGLLPFANSSGYSASKHALQGFFDCLRLDLAGEVDVLVVSPGPVATGIHAYRGLTPAQIERRAMPVARCVSIICEAIEAGRRDVVMTPALKLATKLYPFMPQLVDRYIVRATRRFYASAGSSA